MKLRHLLKYLLFILIAFSCSKGFTQSKDLGYYENKMLAIHTEIDSRLNLKRNIRYDSLIYFNDSVEYFVEKLEMELTRLITDNPKTLDFAFKKLVDSDICRITTSVDGNFRMYDLDSWLLKKTIYQWRGADNVYTKVVCYEEDSSRYCRNIITVAVKGKPYYLPVTFIINYPEQSMESVSVWRIHGNSLDAAPLFKNSLEKLDHIDVPFSVYNLIMEKDSLMRFITYDDKQQKVYVPFVNGMGVFTKSYFIYELKGDYLEFTNIGEMKEEKGIVKPR